MSEWIVITKKTNSEQVFEDVYPGFTSLLDAQTEAERMWNESTIVIVAKIEFRFIPEEDIAVEMYYH